jgi:hypothetical protein
VVADDCIISIALAILARPCIRLLADVALLFLAM